MGNPTTGGKKKAPRDAADKIRALAQDGWSMRGVAHQLGTSWDTLRVWLDADPKLQDAFDLGRETEHRELWNVLFQVAMNGKTEKDKITAAMCLLNARHGYRGVSDEAGGPRINLTFNLPGPLTPDQYTANMKVVSNG